MGKERSLLSKDIFLKNVHLTQEEGEEGTGSFTLQRICLPSCVGVWFHYRLNNNNNFKLKHYDMMS